jgi:hypothetical protein
MFFSAVCVLTFASQLSAQAPTQAAEPSAVPAAGTAPGTPAPIVNNRVFGVLPNYRTASLSEPYRPLTVSRKFYIGYKDSTDYPIFVLGGVLSGLGQWTDQHPSFGQGMKGYGKRYLTSTADQLIGNLFTESIMPSLLHQDPRYFQLGQGSVSKRLGYSASRIFVAKNDSGRWNFNFAELTGNMASAGIGNLYYPQERTWGDNVQRLYSQLATDALSQVFKEFWPDIKRKISKKK